MKISGRFALSRVQADVMLVIPRYPQQTQVSITVITPKRACARSVISEYLARYTLTSLAIQNYRLTVAIAVFEHLITGESATIANSYHRQHPQ
jgi:hypothetical protein